MIEVNTQTIVFLQSLALGFALGLFYDVFRVLRLAVRHSSAIVFLEDICYFIVCAILTFLFSLSAINGHVRVFLVLGELLGATIYYFSLGVLVMGVSKAIIRFVKALLHLLYRILLRPFVRLFGWFYAKLSKAGGKLAQNAKKVRAKTKYTLKRRGILVYNLYVKGNLKKCKKTGIKRGDTLHAKAKSRKAARQSKTV